MAIKQFNLERTPYDYLTLYLKEVWRETQPVSAFKNNIAIDIILTAPTFYLAVSSKTGFFSLRFVSGTRSSISKASRTISHAS